MSDRITIRQAGGAPRTQRFEGDTIATPAAAPPVPTTLDEGDLKRQRELSDENQQWQAKIGGGFTSRDRFMQRWIAKHAEE